ncbi:TPA: hypothetical protein HA235_02265 [Candidatus Woesearchaeota archaeon]|nr:restriction endonuclease subunit S [Candidatus Woesearchaeota archaeon]HIH31508.1 hypothetical protein [Candidatus Woesearchaeota archaeon]HIH54185.1 hypothetical protein [Candidatus Woesearchaeota archaeon]HIJ01129.1 hypothetical protein [Candidatus Woesearchaeota archaeon]HIJ13897.1 hypothetical protein [Candidatus Woesearchaeota archaeon]
MKQKLKQTEIGMIPEDWDVVNIREVSDTYAGGTPSRAHKEYYNGNIRWVKSGEINLGEIFETGEKITETALKNSSVKEIPENTVLVAMYGATAGKVGILKVKGTANQAVLAVPNNKNKFHYQFMYYLLSSKTNKLINSTQGTGQPNLSKFLVDNLELQFPQLSEQKAISEVLYTIDKRLDIVERERRSIERLKVGFMKELFDGKWKKVKLGEIISLEYGKGLSEKERKGGKFAVYGSNGIIGYHTSSLVKGPGIIVGRKGSIGEVCMSEIDFWPIDTSYFVVLKQDLNLKWVYYLLTTLNLSKLNTATGIPGLNRDLAYGQEVRLPSLKEQNRIAEILITLDKKITIQSNKKFKLERVKKSLMDDLLTGKKRVKVND